MPKTHVSSGFFYQEFREDGSGYDIVLVRPSGNTTVLRHTLGSDIVRAINVSMPELAGRALAFLAERY